MRTTQGVGGAASHAIDDDAHHDRRSPGVLQNTEVEGDIPGMLPLELSRETRGADQFGQEQTPSPASRCSGSLAPHSSRTLHDDNGFDARHVPRTRRNTTTPLTGPGSRCGEKRVLWTDTPHTRLFLEHLVLVHTTHWWLKVSQRVSDKITHAHAST